MSNLIPEGYYNAYVVQADGGKWAELGLSSQKGTEQVSVYMKIADGEHAGRVFKWTGYFTEKSVDRTLKSLRYLGFQGDDLSTIETQPLTNVVSITMQQEDVKDGTGKVTGKRMRVGFINSPGGGAKPIESKQAFAAKFKALLAKEPPVKSAVQSPVAVVTNGAASTKNPDINL